MRQQYLPNIHDIMLPHKSLGLVRNYGNVEENYENYSGGSTRSHIETSILSDLVRKVDWLSDEVSSLKQALSVYENRGNSRYPNGYYEPSIRHENWCANNSLRQERVPVSDITPYRSNSIPYVDNQRENYNRDGRNTPPGKVETHPSFFQKYSTSGYTYDTRNPAEYDPDKNPHSTRALTYDATPRYNLKGYNRIDSPGSSSSKSDRPQSASEPINQLEVNLSLPENISVLDIIQLWQHGLDDIPPILSWSVDQKLRCREKLDIYFKVYHLFRICFHGNISRFIAEYNDATGLHPNRVAALCPDVSEAFNAFLNTPSEISLEKNNQKEVFTLPRKINGRKVSAKDVIQLWEHGMGDIPPIKTWTKSQKFKQQSKISRWKKIVDIFKYQCNSDMKTFTQIYSDGHGCLLPVAAITSKFETVYGDELSITSKLMTVSTTSDARHDTSSRLELESHEPKKQKVSYDEGRNKDVILDTFSSHSEETSTLKPPPALIRSSPTPPILFKDKEPTPSPTVIPLSITSMGIDDRTDIPNLICKRENTDDVSGYSSSYPEDMSAVKSKNLPPNNNYSWTLTNTPDSDTNDGKMNIEDSSETSTGSINRILSPSATHVPENIDIKDAIALWEKGSNDIPPIKKWTPQQKEKQKELISRVEKIYFIYSDIFKRNYKYFLRECSNINGELQSIDETLLKFNSFIVERGPFLAQPQGISTSSMTFDFSHHKTLSQSTDELYLLPRKINGRKVNAKDVLQLWYHGVNKIPPVKHWSPQQKAVQQSKISRWKKIVDLYEQDFHGNWEHFENHFSNNSGQLLPISAIIAKHEEEHREMGSTDAHLYH